MGDWIRVSGVWKGPDFFPRLGWIGRMTDICLGKMVANIVVCLCNFWILNQKWQQKSKTTLFSSLELRGKGLIFKIVQQSNVSVTIVSVYYFVLFSFCSLLFFPFAVNKAKKKRNAAQQLSIALRNRSWTSNSESPESIDWPWQFEPGTAQWTWLSCTPETNQFCRLNSWIEHPHRASAKRYWERSYIRWLDPQDCMMWPFIFRRPQNDLSILPNY